MPPKKTKKDYAPHQPPERAPRCQTPGCKEPGAYKAPKSRKELHEYQWHCLDHIREYNQKWDFFKDMDSDAIEFFIRDAVTGHRPTWSREARMRRQYDALHDALYEFLYIGAEKRPKSAPPPDVQLRKSLAALDLDYPYTQRQLKTRYRELARKYHPDVNKGDKAAEEKFKQVAVAYLVLAEHVKNG